MKAVKLMATVDKQGSLSLDQPLSIMGDSSIEVLIFIPETVDIDKEDELNETREEILNDFRQAWHEAMSEQTIPVSQLWEGIKQNV